MTIKKSRTRKRKGSLEEQQLRDWCQARRSLYRRWWLKDPRRLDVIMAARRPYVGLNKRQKWEYQCSKCLGWYLKTQTHVDHTSPCGSFLKKEDEIQFRHNLINNSMTLMCKICHQQKTKEERLKS